LIHALGDALGCASVVVGVMRVTRSTESCHSLLLSTAAGRLCHPPMAEGATPTGVTGTIVRTPPFNLTLTPALTHHRRAGHHRAHAVRAVVAGRHGRHRAKPPAAPGRHAAAAAGRGRAAKAARLFDAQPQLIHRHDLGCVGCVGMGCADGWMGAPLARAALLIMCELASLRCLQCSHSLLKRLFFLNAGA